MNLPNMEEARELAPKLSATLIMCREEAAWAASRALLAVVDILPGVINTDNCKALIRASDEVQRVAEFYHEVFMERLQHSVQSYLASQQKAAATGGEVVAAAGDASPSSVAVYR